MLGELHMPESLSLSPSSCSAARVLTCRETLVRGTRRRCHAGKGQGSSLVLVTFWLGAGVSRVRKQNSRDKERLCGNTEGFLTPLNPSLVSSAVRLTRSTCDCLFFPAPEERGCSTVGGVHKATFAQMKIKSFSGFTVCSYRF